jgi:integration host factor subunit beta
LTLSIAIFTVEALHDGLTAPSFSDPSAGSTGQGRHVLQEKGPVTKKEIVKQISDRIGLTQLKTKDIVQQTFDAIVETLLEVGRIELRNFGVFEVKQRKARKARNPRTGDRVDVPPKNVVTFKPGKEMEEKVRSMTRVVAASSRGDKDEQLVAETINGLGDRADSGVKAKVKAGRARKAP